MLSRPQNADKPKWCFARWKKPQPWECSAPGGLSAVSKRLVLMGFFLSSLCPGSSGNLTGLNIPAALLFSSEAVRHDGIFPVCWFKKSHISLAVYFLPLLHSRKTRMPGFGARGLIRAAGVFCSSFRHAIQAAVITPPTKSAIPVIP